MPARPSSLTPSLSVENIRRDWHGHGQRETEDAKVESRVLANLKFRISKRFSYSLLIKATALEHQIEINWFSPDERFFDTRFRPRVYGPMDVADTVTVVVT